MITAIGGWMGQLMIFLNTVAKYYPHLDRPVRTGRSKRSGSRPRSRASGKSGGGDAKSQKSEAEKSEGVESEIPRQILNPQVVQQFIFTYIQEKLKTDKFSLLTDSRYEKFLQSLPSPLELNQMRKMKEDKYLFMRKLLSKYMGSPVLRLIKDN